MAPADGGKDDTHTHFLAGPDIPHARWIDVRPDTLFSKACIFPLANRGQTSTLSLRSRAQRLESKRLAHKLSDRLGARLECSLLWHGRISKCTEPLEGQSSGRRGWRRFGETSPLSQVQGLGRLVRKTPRAGRRDERRQHCLRGMKPQGPWVLRGPVRAEPVKSGELGPKAPCWLPSR